MDRSAAVVVEAVEAVIQEQEAVLYAYEAEIDDKTCEQCLSYHEEIFTEEEIQLEFPYHEFVSLYLIKPMVHPNCRCRLVKLVGIEGALEA